MKNYPIYLNKRANLVQYRVIDDPTRLNEEDWDRIVGVFVHVRKIFWKISKLLRVLGPSLAIQGLEMGRKSGADFLPNTGLSLVL